MSVECCPYSNQIRRPSIEFPKGYPASLYSAPAVFMNSATIRRMVAVWAFFLLSRRFVSRGFMFRLTGFWLQIQYRHTTHKLKSLPGKSIKAICRTDCIPICQIDTLLPERSAVYDHQFDLAVRLLEQVNGQRRGLVEYFQESDVVSKAQ